MLATVALVSAVVAQAAIPDPTITQSGLSVASERDPAITLKVTDGFSPLPPILLSLPSTNVDRRVFVKADAFNRIQSMVVFQFERVRSGSSFQFLYPPKPAFAFGSDIYRIGTYIYDDEAAAKASPGYEAAVTREALSHDGYLVPRLLRTVRLARVAEPNGLSEIIIFYFENADADFPSGLTLKIYSSRNQAAGFQTATISKRAVCASDDGISSPRSSRTRIRRSVI